MLFLKIQLYRILLHKMRGKNKQPFPATHFLRKVGILTYLCFDRKMLFQSERCFIKKYLLLKLILLRLFAGEYICSHPLPYFQRSPTAPHVLLPPLTIVTIPHIYSSCSRGHSHPGDSACAVCAAGSPAPRCRRHPQRPGEKAQLEAAACSEEEQWREERALLPSKVSLALSSSADCRVKGTEPSWED